MNGAIIAALNEAETISGLVKSLRNQGFEVCVIDDGSTDGTEYLAKDAGADVIRHNKPLGIGRSLRDGWYYAINKGWVRTVQIDAGGSHDPQDVKQLLTSGTDITIGSRFMPYSKYIGRRWRAFASRVVAHALNFATRQKITDWTSGYRIFSRRALDSLVNVNYMTNMHTWQIEVLNAGIEKGLTVSEFPITYRSGDSTMKLSTVDDLIKVYLWILHR